MTALSPVLPSPAGLPARAEPMLPASRAERPAPASPIDSARAVQPVEQGRDPATIRFVDRDGRPVGPPPSFPVTLLEAQRQASLPAPPQPADGQAAWHGYDTSAQAPGSDSFDRRV